jgi:acetyl-CoA decarbonylase/synthase complex subunit gamma
MSLTGIEIYKSLPKTNCGKCGVPTCLSFAMRLAAVKTELAACPYLSLESQARLEEALTPAIRVVTIGAGDNPLKIGGETVLFRHEKRFENPPGIALTLRDTMDPQEIQSCLDRFHRLVYPRAGATLRLDLLALDCASHDAQRYQELVRRVAADKSVILILMCPDPGILDAAITVCQGQRPLLYAATEATLEQYAVLARKWNCPVAVRAESLEQAAILTMRLNQAGVRDIVIDPGPRKVQPALAAQVRLRSAAVNQRMRSLGYPTIVFPSEMTPDSGQAVVLASLFIAKYAGLIVMSDFPEDSIFPLLLARFNLYSDPQRPLATTEGIYELGNPGPEAPVLVTANFSLTYFIVSSEIEASRVPAFLMVKDTEGLSVLTAWAAGKFLAHTIAPFILKSNIASRVRHHRLILPGYIAQEACDLAQELPGWQVEAGPREAAQIPAFLKAWKA